MPGDDADEMFQGHHLDDAIIDRILSGRRVDGEHDLTSFMEDVQIALTAPPVPSAALMGVFADGLSHVKGDLPATAASNVTGPEIQAAGLPQRKRKHMLEIALAKLGTMALVAKMGVAAGAVTLGATAAAAVGTLPAPAQDLASDAAARAGIEIPASEGRQDANRRQDADRRQDAERRADVERRQDPDRDEVAAEGEAPTSDSFGSTVSGGAKELEPGEGKDFGENTANNAPKAAQATEAPSATDNPGTTARPEAPAAAPAPMPAPAPAPVASAAPAAELDRGTAPAPAETSPAPSNPGGTRRP